jgi:hypothetical protein
VAFVGRLSEEQMTLVLKTLADQKAGRAALLRVASAIAGVDLEEQKAADSPAAEVDMTLLARGSVGRHADLVGGCGTTKSEPTDRERDGQA